MQNVHGYFSLLYLNFRKQRQTNGQGIITHAYKAIVLVAVAVNWFSLAHKHKHKPTYAEAVRS